MKIPSWDEVAAKHKSTRSPLETFIYEYEPAGEVEATLFRQRLQSLMDGIAGVLATRQA